MAGVSRGDPRRGTCTGASTGKGALLEPSLLCPSTASCFLSALQTCDWAGLPVGTLTQRKLFAGGRPTAQQCPPASGGRPSPGTAGALPLERTQGCAGSGLSEQTVSAHGRTGPREEGRLEGWTLSRCPPRHPRALEHLPRPSHGRGQGQEPTLPLGKGNTQTNQPTWPWPSCHSAPMARDRVRLDGIRLALGVPGGFWRCLPHWLPEDQPCTNARRGHTRNRHEAEWR